MVYAALVVVLGLVLWLELRDERRRARDAAEAAEAAYRSLCDELAADRDDR
jgi:uncharacterized membrane protein